MPILYAQIDGGIIINILVAKIDDFFDPNFIWIDLTNITPKPQIGWLYDNNTFIKPGLPDDIYGYSVIFSTDNIIDTYKNSLGIIIKVPAGTLQKSVYLSLAIQNNINLLLPQAEAFVQSRYSDSTRLNLLGLFLNAQINNFTNRIAYLTPLFVWQNSIISYLGQYCALVKAQTTPEAVVALQANFNPFITSDPLVTPINALQIPN